MLARRLLSGHRKSGGGFKAFATAFYANANGMFRAGVVDNALEFDVTPAPNYSRQWSSASVQRDSNNRVALLGRDRYAASALAYGLAVAPFGTTKPDAPLGPVLPVTLVALGYDGTSATTVSVRKRYTYQSWTTPENPASDYYAWTTYLYNNELNAGTFQFNVVLPKGSFTWKPKTGTYQPGDSFQAKDSAFAGFTALTYSTGTAGNGSTNTLPASWYTLNGSTITLTSSASSTTITAIGATYNAPGSAGAPAADASTASRPSTVTTGYTKGSNGNSYPGYSPFTNDPYVAGYLKSSTFKNSSQTSYTGGSLSYYKGNQFDNSGSGSYFWSIDSDTAPVTTTQRRTGQNPVSAQVTNYTRLLDLGLTGSSRFVTYVATLTRKQIFFDNSYTVTKRPVTVKDDPIALGSYALTATGVASSPASTTKMDTYLSEYGYAFASYDMQSGPFGSDFSTVNPTRAPISQGNGTYDLWTESGGAANVADGGGAFRLPGGPLLDVAQRANNPDLSLTAALADGPQGGTPGGYLAGSTPTLPAPTFLTAVAMWGTSTLLSASTSAYVVKDPASGDYEVDYPAIGSMSLALNVGDDLLLSGSGVPGSLPYCLGTAFRQGLTFGASTGAYTFPDAYSLVEKLSPAPIFLYALAANPVPVPIDIAAITGAATSPPGVIERAAGFQGLTLLGRRGNTAYFAATLTRYSSALVDVSAYGAAPGNVTYQGNSYARVGYQQTIGTYGVILAYDCKNRKLTSISAPYYTSVLTRVFDAGQQVDGSGNVVSPLTVINWTKPGSQFSAVAQSSTATAGAPKLYSFKDLVTVPGLDANGDSAMVDYAVDLVNMLAITLDGRTLRTIPPPPVSGWTNGGAYCGFVLQHAGALVCVDTTNGASIAASSNAVLSVDLGQNWKVANLTCPTPVALPGASGSGKSQGSLGLALFAY